MTPSTSSTTTSDLWAGVLTGTTDVFSAGSDLTAGGDYLTARGGEYGIIRRRRRKPLIAAVEGPALGGGLEIVLACDLVVAASTARFGLPEVSIGVVPTCAGLFRAPRALPLNVARQLILTGRPIDARRAYEVGFVNVLTEPGGALAGGRWRWPSRSAPTRRSRCRRASPAVNDHHRRRRRTGLAGDRRGARCGRRIGRRPRRRRRVPREATAGLARSVTATPGA